MYFHLATGALNRAGVRRGMRVLDVAAGNGNASLAAARRFCHVTSTDYVPELLEKARQPPVPGPPGGVRPLTGTAADYDPLIERAAGARFVLLGEASHGNARLCRARAGRQRRTKPRQ